MNTILYFGKFNYYFLLFTVYFFSHVGILALPNAIYWDDWTLFSVDPDAIIETFKQAGALFNWTSKLHNGLLLLGPFTYKYITFILMFLTGLFLDLILRDFKIEIGQRFLLIVLFLVLPFNSARVALINLPYTLGYFLFFLAWYLINRNRFLSLFFFFLSFNINSLLVFYAFPIMGVWLIEGNTINSDGIIKFARKYIFFIFLPFFYFSIKNIFFKPSGDYEKYYSLIGIDYSNNILISSRIVFYDFLFFISEKLILLVFIFSFVAIFFILNKKLFFNNLISIKQGIIYIILGIIAILFGTIPYLILGLSPTFLEWSSRHQLLLPLGASLFILGGLSFFKSSQRLFLFAFIVISSITINILNYIDFYNDWNKQKNLISLFKENELIRNAGIIGFVDETKSLNAINRTYRIYEWNGLLKSAFDDELRFGVDGEGFKWVKERGNNPNFVNRQNNNKDYINNSERPNIVVKILHVNNDKVPYFNLFNSNSITLDVKYAKEPNN